MSTLEIVGIAYIALDIILGIIIYAIIRAKGWRRMDIARNFRNLLRLRNRDFKKTIAEQVGYADYHETYHEGYDNGYADGRQAVLDEIEEEKRRKEQEDLYKRYIPDNLLTSILGIFGF